MPNLDLKALRETFDKSTQGEWFDIPNPQWSGSDHRIGLSKDEPWGNFGQLCYASPVNARFIATAHNTYSQLLDIAEKAAQLHDAANEIHLKLCALCSSHGPGTYAVYLETFNKYDAALAAYRKAREGK